MSIQTLYSKVTFIFETKKPRSSIRDCFKYVPYPTAKLSVGFLKFDEISIFTDIFSYKTSTASSDTKRTVYRLLCEVISILIKDKKLIQYSDHPRIEEIRNSDWKELKILKMGDILLNFPYEFVQFEFNLDNLLENI